MDIDVLGEVNSSDKSFVSAGMTATQPIVSAWQLSKYLDMESHCKNWTSTTHVVVQTPSHTFPIRDDVKQFCVTKSKGELEELLVSMAFKCPQL